MARDFPDEWKEEERVVSSTVRQQPEVIEIIPALTTYLSLERAMLRAGASGDREHEELLLAVMDETHKRLGWKDREFLDNRGSLDMDSIKKIFENEDVSIAVDEAHQMLVTNRHSGEVGHLIVKEHGLAEIRSTSAVPALMASARAKL